MLKQLVLLLFAVSFAGAVQSVSAQGPIYVTNPPVTMGVVTVSPHTPDLSRNPIVIGKTIYDPYNTVFTTVTLQLVQDEKGKVVGNASFTSNRAAEGKVGVSFPIDIPVVGKIKGSEVKLKGKLKIVQGSEGDVDKRKVSLNINGSLVGFDPVDLPKPDARRIDDLQSTATYRFDVQVGGLGFNYDFVQDAQIHGRYLFIYQTLPPHEALGLKFPKGGDLYKVWTPWGTTLAKGYVAVDEQQNTVLTLKGKKFQYTGIETGGNGTAPFLPDTMLLKTSYGKVQVSVPEMSIDLHDFQIFDGGPVN